MDNTGTSRHIYQTRPRRASAGYMGNQLRVMPSTHRTLKSSSLGGRGAKHLIRSEEDRRVWDIHRLGRQPSSFRLKTTILHREGSSGRLIDKTISPSVSRVSTVGSRPRASSTSPRPVSLCSGPTRHLARILGMLN